MRGDTDRSDHILPCAGLAQRTMGSKPVANAPSFDKVKIAVIGLGYVGLPLAVALARQVPGHRLRHRCRAGSTSLRAATTAPARSTTRNSPPARTLRLTADPSALRGCRLLHRHRADADRRRPSAPTSRRSMRRSETVGRVLTRGDVVVYESTVYPGATEEVCVPVLEGASGLTSTAISSSAIQPERINPGDQAAPAADDHQGDLRARRPKPPTSSTSSTARSSPPASTGAARSRWPKPPRSSRTPSATSTSP